jgi:hypothetical protein
MSDSQYAAAETLTRRGMEESIRLLDEQLARVSQRCEREATGRREAERQCATLSAELESVRTELAHATQERNVEDSERAYRERDRYDTMRKLEGALADRAAFEASGAELKSEVEVMAQRLEAEGRARAALQESFALVERELAEARERTAQHRQQSLDLQDTQRSLETQLRDALRATADKTSEATELSTALRDANSELELVQRRHAAEAEARQGLQAAEQLRVEELNEAHRAAQLQARMVAELQQAEVELSASLQSTRAQLQQALAERAEVEREHRRLASITDRAAGRVAEVERAKAEALAAGQRATEEARELRAALEALSARERVGEAQRTELASTNEMLRSRLDAEVRARASLEDALRAVRGAAATSRSSFAPQPQPPQPPRPSPAPPPSTMSYELAPSPATFLPPPPAYRGAPTASAAARALAGELQTMHRSSAVGGKSANGGVGGGWTGYGHGTIYGAAGYGATSHDEGDTFSDSGFNGGSTGSRYDRGVAAVEAAAAEAAESEGAAMLSRIKEEMKLNPRTSSFDPQLRAVREALAAETSAAPPRPVPADSPLETRKQQLSEELKKLKARLQPMGPPPSRPARGAAAAATPAPPVEGADNGLPAQPVFSCDPTCSPVVRGGAGSTYAATPATQLGPPPSKAPQAYVPSLPSERIRALAGTPTAEELPMSPGHRSAALSGLELSQRQLEDKLAALKRKLEAES